MSRHRKMSREARIELNLDTARWHEARALEHVACAARNRFDAAIFGAQQHFAIQRFRASALHAITAIAIAVAGN